MAQIESIRPEAAQRYADYQRRRPLVALRPVAALPLVEVSLAQAQQIRLNGTIGTSTRKTGVLWHTTDMRTTNGLHVQLLRRIAVVLWRTRVLPQLSLPTVAAQHVALEIACSL